MYHEYTLLTYGFSWTHCTHRRRISPEPILSHIRTHSSRNWHITSCIEALCSRECFFLFFWFFSRIFILENSRYTRKNTKILDISHPEMETNSPTVLPDSLSEYHRDRDDRRTRVYWLDFIFCGIYIFLMDICWYTFSSTFELTTMVRGFWYDGMDPDFACDDGVCADWGERHLFS